MSIQTRIRPFLVGCLMLIPLAGPSQAARVYNADTVEVEVVSDRGREFQQIPTRSDRGSDATRSWLVAEPNRNYAIRVHNRSRERVGLVIAVDGRNILDGSYSNLRYNEAMYVLGPGEEAEYSGWRTERDRVNRFVFTDFADSYAAAWDDPSAPGTIAVAVFAEDRPEVRVPQSTRKRAPAGSLAEDSAGTGFGEEEYSPTRRVHFRAESRPMEKHFIKYEWRETLCRNGVLDCRNRHRDNRFWPRPHANERYAPYPPGWRY
ncbi:MAG: hypothetical protein KDH88_05465 [Chromatiales bacterium]|nr:hypothetical protein [Chromatiales bacterium]